jgi:glucosamine--fructose-6-phosphate aminotransferase (isomerizing)
MTPTKTIIEGTYLRELLEQPQAVENTISGFRLDARLQQIARQAAQLKWPRIILTGMGASLHALHPLNLQLIAHGFTSLIVETSELIHYMAALLDEKTLVVAVSQSGRSAETVRLLEVQKNKGTLIGITNSADSPLAVQTNAAIVTHAGKESTVSCKTYVSSLAALAWLGDVLCEGKPGQNAKDLEQAASAIARYLDKWEQHVAELSDELGGVRDIFFVGRGPSLAAAYSGGLIVKESTRYHSEGMSSAALRHGPFEMMKPDVFVLVYSGDTKVEPLNRALVPDIRAASGRAFLCGPEAELEALRLPHAPPAVMPLLEILPAQMISLALASLAGIEAGRFERATKVTDRE